MNLNTFPPGHVLDCAASADGRFQMALDDFLIRSAPKIPLLRLYRMTPPCVTIGRHQRWRKVIDEERVQGLGWNWCRRPTGGGALLHKDELNYTVVARRGLLAGRGEGEFRSVFSRISGAVSAALHGLGVLVEHMESDNLRSRRQHGLCGRAITNHEIGLNGKKLVAAAQLITSDTVLQHGTIYLTSPTADERFWPDDSASDVENWTDIGQAYRNLCWQDIASIFQHNFIANIGSPCQSYEVSEADWQEAIHLANEWEISSWHTSR